MGILTNLPTVLAVGIPQTVTIDKAQVVTDFAITDTFWSNPNNWSEIQFHYYSDQSGSQHTSFNFTNSNDKDFKLNSNSRDGEWLCQKITIKDGLNGNLSFARANFPAITEFDFSSTGGFSDAVLSLWDELFGDMLTSGGGELHRNGGPDGWSNVARTSQALSGDFSLTGNFNKFTTGDQNHMIGYIRTPTTPTSDPRSNVDTAVFFNGNSIKGYLSGFENTATETNTAIADNTTGLRSFEISRTSGVIVGKINGTTFITDSFSGHVYLIGMFFHDDGSSITEAAVTE